MINMSYCQFENTLADLKDCDEWLAENDPDKLSESEHKAFDRMVRLCKEIAANYDDGCP